MSEVREDPQSKDMAEETSGVTNRDAADFSQGETQSTDDLVQNLKQQHKVTTDMASSSEPANPDTKNDGNVCNTAVDNSVSAKKEVVFPPEGSFPNKDSTPKTEEKNSFSQADVENHGDNMIKDTNSEGSSPDMDSTSKMEDKSSLSQADIENHGDTKQDSPKNEEPAKIAKAKSEFSEGKTQLTNTNHDIPCEENIANDVPQNLKQQDKVTADKSHTGEQEARETTTLPILGDRKDDQVDGHKAKLNEELTATNDKNAGDDVKNVLASDEDQDTQESPTFPQVLSEKQQLDECGNDVETIGPTTQEATKRAGQEVTAGKRTYLLVVSLVVVFVALLVQHLLQPESPPQKNDVRQIDIFLRQLEKVKTQFPNQRAELWNRSRIHLKRHLQTAQPTEPVSLILTAGLRAERTLNCLAQSLASAFSSALNASFLHIDGASKASQDSDQVKLDIDRKLQGAFEGDKPVAIIHRFEELPPGSTLIFYRYCDHENAAYKKTFLIFTVLLGEEEEIPTKISLSAVEEMVDDHLQKKFLSHGHPVSFDMMDLDKYGGLWSRISHLILPVAAEERKELEGC